MERIDTISALRSFLGVMHVSEYWIGLVPTMGALHDGHRSLIRRAREENDTVVVSIFVNPTQFGPGEDFAKYPRDLERDANLSREMEVDALFTPSVEEMYPNGPPVTVDVPDLARRWEGEFRPGHFRGVATVCVKLFNIVQPTRAYFGQKDYQQLRVIQRMVDDLHIPTEIVPVPSLREPDGLALSSRNVYLNPEQRRAATVLYRALRAAQERFEAGERSSA